MVLVKSTMWAGILCIQQLSNTVTGEYWHLQTNANQIKPKLELHAFILMLRI